MSGRNPIEIRTNVEKKLISIVNAQTTEFTDVKTFTDLIKTSLKEMGVDAELNTKIPIATTKTGKLQSFTIDFVCGVPGVTRFVLVTEYVKKEFKILDRVFW
jgi:hypothetical protein